jgi:signal peptidase I
LRLTLKKKWFDMIASGEKTEEYRTPSEWIFSRLIGKGYDVVEFSNGYGKHVPRVVVKYFGWHQGPGRTEWGASWQNRYVVIRLGHVISLHNEKALRAGRLRAHKPETDVARPDSQQRFVRRLL